MKHALPEWIVAIEAFRAKFSNKTILNKRGFSNWKDALLAAWLQGWDDREPDGHFLRAVRNNLGPAWLVKYEGAKSVKPDVFIRSMFDTKCRTIGRNDAARLIKRNRDTARRVPVGWRFLNGMESVVISTQPINQNVNL